MMRPDDLCSIFRIAKGDYFSPSPIRNRVICDHEMKDRHGVTQPLCYREFSVSPKDLQRVLPCDPEVGCQLMNTTGPSEINFLLYLW